MSIETEIRIRTDSVRGDTQRAEQEFDKLRSNVQKMEMRLNVVLNDKAVRQQLDKLLDDLQKRANQKPIVIPSRLGDHRGGRPSTAPIGVFDGGGGGDEGGLAETAAAGAGGAVAAGRTGALQGALQGIGKVTAAYAVVRAATAALDAVNEKIEERRARMAGDIDKEIELQEKFAQRLKSFPVVGQLGGAIHHLATQPERAEIDRIERETALQEKLNDLLTRRNQIMRQSVDHSKEVLRNAQAEAAERDRPGSGTIEKAREALRLEQERLRVRQMATGTPLTAEEKSGVGAMRQNLDRSIIELSRKELKEGTEDLQKYREHIDKARQAWAEFAEKQRETANRIGQARLGATIMGLRAGGRGDEADLLEIGQRFDRQMDEIRKRRQKLADENKGQPANAAASAADAALVGEAAAVTDERMAAINAKQLEQRRRHAEAMADVEMEARESNLRAAGQGYEADKIAFEAAWDAKLRKVENFYEWLAGVDAKRAAQREREARRDLDIQRGVSGLQELTQRNRGHGAVADFIGLRQQIREDIQNAEGDPKKLQIATQMGQALMEQFIKGARGGGGVFSGGVDFARHTQAAILADAGKGRLEAIEMAKAFANELARGGFQLGVIKR